MKPKILYSLILLFLVGFGTQAQEEIPVLKTTHIYKDTLGLDYYRAKAEDFKTKPLVVLVHGGGFYEGRRDGAGEEKLSREMAAMGFNVASISYRLTRKGKGFGCDCPASDKIKTFLYATEDLMAAIDFVNGDPEFEFDRENVFLLGSSAGAETVLAAAYMTRHYDFEKIEPRKFKGVIALAGAVVDSKYITEENAVPALLVHGEKDDLVPFSTAAHHYCDPEETGYLILDGSATIAKRLASLGSSYIIAVDPEGNHDWATEGYELTELIGQFVKNISTGVEIGTNRIRIQSSRE